jgi:hypothetical protein
VLGLGVVFTAAAGLAPVGWAGALLEREVAELGLPVADHASASSPSPPLSHCLLQSTQNVGIALSPSVTGYTNLRMPTACTRVCR